MTRRTRNGNLAAVTVGFALVVTCLYSLLVWDLSAAQAENRTRAEGYVGLLSTQAQERLGKVCSALDGPALAECISETMATTREHQRAEADLAAQRDMAKWAWAVMLTSALSLGVGVVGIYFLKSTLDKTAEAVLVATRSADIAQKIGEAQVRAYLIVAGGSFSVGKGSIRYNIRIKNVGQSPAVNVRASCEVQLASPHSSDKYFKAWKASIASVPAGGEETAFFFYNIPGDPDFRAYPPVEYPEVPVENANILREMIHPHLNVQITIGWDDVFGRRQNQTFSTHEVSTEQSVSDDGSVLDRKGELAAGKTSHYRDNVENRDR